MTCYTSEKFGTLFFPKKTPRVESELHHLFFRCIWLELSPSIRGMKMKSRFKKWRIQEIKTDWSEPNASLLQTPQSSILKPLVEKEAEPNSSSLIESKKSSNRFLKHINIQLKFYDSAL